MQGCASGSLNIFDEMGGRGGSASGNPVEKCWEWEPETLSRTCTCRGWMRCQASRRVLTLVVWSNLHPLP